MKDIVKAKTDVVFKIMFARESGKEHLKNFISDVLEIPYDSINNIEVENPEITPEEIDGKFTRFDLKLTVNNELVNVEIQVNNHPGFKERVLYYWAQRYGNQLEKGQGYDEIKKTISINIADFKMFDTESYCSTYTMADLEHNAVLTDKCAIHFFELAKLDKKVDAKDRKKLWMQLINSESEEELEMLSNTNVESIKSAADTIFKLSSEKDVRDMERRREERLREEAWALNSARREGVVEGRREGHNDLLRQLLDEGVINEETYGRFTKQ